jgi:hypothetical protein
MQAHDDRRGTAKTRSGQAPSEFRVLCPHCLVEVRPRYAAVSWLGAAYHARCLDVRLSGSLRRQRAEAA